MSKIIKPKGSPSLAKICGLIALDKLAKKILLLDLRKIETAPADFFVICSSDSDIQSRAITDEILKRIKNFKLPKPHVEGEENANWILIDFFDVVVHIMLENTRKFYQLEKLWSDAKFSIINEDGAIKKFNIKELNYDKDW